MKKYLLMIESKKLDYVQYELYDNYDDLIEQVVIAHEIAGDDSEADVITRWFRIDNLNKDPLKIFKILKTLNNYIAKNWRNYGK